MNEIESAMRSFDPAMMDRITQKSCEEKLKALIREAIQTPPAPPHCRANQEKELENETTN